MSGVGLPSLIPPSAPHSSKDVWFDDGNVILQAESTLFRVFRGILSSNSPVFADMFSVPQPSTSIEMFDSCPLIQIFDSAEDVKHFLKAIHDASYYDVKTTSEFSVVAGILRLSSKYSVSYLRKRAISHLITMFPSSLQDFQDNRSQATNIAKLNHYTGLSMEVVNLAKTARVPMLLPISLYYCAVMRLEYILDGVFVGNEGDETFRKIELDWPEKRAILLGRRALVDRARHSLFSFLLVPADPASNLPNAPTAAGCAYPQRCEIGKLKWLRQMEPLLSGDKCGPLHMQFDWQRYGADVCMHCVLDGKNKYREGLRKSWEELPSFFGLDTWAALKAESAE